MAGKKRAQRGLSYFEHLKQALEKIGDPEALGNQSPLAAPYFLGESLHTIEPSPVARGMILQQEIDQAVQSLWGGPLPDDGPSMLAAADDNSGHDGRYLCVILELNYFKARFRPPPRTQAEIYHDILHVSRPTHDRHLRSAVERLGEVLLQRLRPAIRPERPMLPAAIIGREELIESLMAELGAGKTVTLAGAGGVGKTTAGAVAVDRWPTPAVFWYTFRLAFNDQLENLLFALGHFLHTHGASTLWHQLIADGGRIKDTGLAAGLALNDLERLPNRPLLCFDELDFLRPSDLGESSTQHLRILEFLDSLRGEVALLLIGQRAYWESDHTLQVDGFTAKQLAEYLSVLSVPHTPADVAALFEYTDGNVRLADLCIVLFQADAGATLADVLHQLPRSHALLPIWHRIERRLTVTERSLLRVLAIFRSTAPVDAWQDEEGGSALEGLAQRRLVHLDARGGVTILPVLRELIYGDQAIEDRERNHLIAADIRAERGDYTAAAYHLAQAGQTDGAVALWYANRQGEINRGQAGAALSIFTNISQRRLPAKRRKELLLMRSELYQLAGEPEKVIEELADESWPPDEEESVDAALLLGKALETTGAIDASRQQYTLGIAVATQLLDKLARITIERSLSYLHERNLSAAWYDVWLARHHVDLMQGAIYEQSGSLDEAWTHYEAALELAQRVDYRPGIARAHLHMGTIAMRKLDVERSIDHYTRSMAAYEELGDRVRREITRSGMATAHMQAQQYLLALEPAKTALKFFERMKDSFWIALNASDLAEAYVELANLPMAEEHAQRALMEEEPHSHPYALFSLGRIRLLQARPDEALYHLRQAQAIAEQNQDQYLLAYVWEELGAFYVDQDDVASGRDAFNRARKGFEQLGIDAKAEEVSGALANLSEVT